MSKRKRDATSDDKQTNSLVLLGMNSLVLLGMNLARFFSLPHKERLAKQYPNAIRIGPIVSVQLQECLEMIIPKEENSRTLALSLSFLRARQHVIWVVQSRSSRPKYRDAKFFLKDPKMTVRCPKCQITFLASSVLAHGSGAFFTQDRTYGDPRCKLDYFVLFCKDCKPDDIIEPPPSISSNQESPQAPTTTAPP